MATILLSAVGASVGAGFGGALGLSGAVIGRAIGATAGRLIDERILGAGSKPVEVGRVERFRLTGAGEGAAIARVWGRVRLGGQVIWASNFAETVTETGGGKGSAPRVTEYGYSVSLAVALCEGEILRVGRVWADGQEMAVGDLDLRVYTGGEDQLPDPLIEAIEGAGNAPAYRGLAYVVIENLGLARFGNRVPQFSFEVVRRAEPGPAGPADDLADVVRAVALIPGTGEYALATTPVHFDLGPGVARSANVNSASGQADMTTALRQLTEEAPRCAAASLIVSWFGDDLRAAECRLRPKVEARSPDGVGMPWQVAGIGRDAAEVIAQIDGRPVYGGTPADAAVIEAIGALRAAGQAVMFYPFILMEQLAGNTLPDPYSGAEGQAPLPWRGRITTRLAPDHAGTTDRSAAAEAEVAAFFGSAQPSDFVIRDGAVVYSGPEEWRYRRFILHYAYLCKLAGGVEAFCVGSEMRGLTRIRGANDSFPAVAQMVRLVEEVRAILGPDVKISYAADWSEYAGFGDAAGNRYFHLDPLWAHEDVDFVGIDNYMPLSDWRDGEDHADAAARSIYNLSYLQGNIEGGEGFDWFYPSDIHRDRQDRKPITDGAYDEPWVFRVKDLRGWWANRHHERRGGLRAEAPTDWVPQSKPLWFTELGCPAIDKGTNQPNKFVDPKSSESAYPHYSSGARDDVIQMQYLRAMARHWGEGANNPISEVYGAPMLDLSRAFVWAWDTRPFPAFPANDALWSDGANYSLGHWISGRVSAAPLAAVVAEICAEAGVTAVDVSGLHGVVRGYVRTDVGSARAALQGLMLAYGFDAAERDGVIRFRMRHGWADLALSPTDMAVHPDFDGPHEAARLPEPETAGRVRLGFIEAEGDFDARVEEAVMADDAGLTVAQSDLALCLTRAEARGIATRWLAEARIARDGLRLALPRARVDAAGLGAGDVIALEGRRWRIDRLERGAVVLLEAVRVDPAVYRPAAAVEVRTPLRPMLAPLPVFPVLMDLPLLDGTEDPIAPWFAASATPWPGPVALWDGESEDSYRLNGLWTTPATLGVLLADLPAAAPGVWQRGPAMRLRLGRGRLASASKGAVLAGANALALGDGVGPWEVVQFRDARLIAAGAWEVSMLLRGQAGTDGVMPPVWPAGTLVVALDGGARQIAAQASQRGVRRFYRAGVAARGVDDRAVSGFTATFQGVGLRPYAPVHLRCRPLGADLAFSWVRRTRVDGDLWDLEEVPLGEAIEAYRLRILQGGAVRREATVTAPAFTYDAAARAADGLSGPWRFEVAQLSDRFGPGPFTGIDLND